MSPPTILHLDQPRSGGHLLQRMLSFQPQRHHLDHPFSQARGKQVQWLTGGGDVQVGMSAELRRQFDAEIDKGVAAWEAGAREAEAAGHVLMVQEHAFNSATPETVLGMLALIERGAPGAAGGANVVDLPDRLLLAPRTIPLFTVRDPRLAVPSAFRVLRRFGLEHGGGRAMLAASTSPLWIRRLYEWFVARGVEPVVVDCDDLQTAASTDFLQRLCVRLGLRPEEVRLRWPKVSEQERRATHPSFYASQSTLLESEGVDAALAARNRDLDEEEKGWAEEFGEDEGLVKGRVEEAMGCWEWLVARKFK